MVEKVLQINRERTIFWSLIVAIFLTVAFYMFCVNATVHNIVLRENLESEASDLVLSISNQEFQYIKAKSAISMETAKTLGFREVSQKTYINKNSENQVSYLPR